MKYTFSKLLLMIGASCIGAQALAATAPGDLCTTDNYVVGFFNGEWASEAQSILATRAI